MFGFLRFVHADFKLTSPQLLAEGQQVAIILHAEGVVVTVCIDVTRQTTDELLNQFHENVIWFLPRVRKLIELCVDFCDSELNALGRVGKPGKQLLASLSTRCHIDISLTQRQCDSRGYLQFRFANWASHICREGKEFQPKVLWQTDLFHGL
jgi:hypothetical protein